MAINRELRPLDMGGIFSTTLELYRDNVALFIGIVALLEIPEAILSFLVQVASPTPITTSGGKIHFNGGALAGSLALNGGLALIGLVFGALITGALARAISARYLGRTISIEQAYASIGTSTFVTLVVASILEGIVVGVGFIFIVLPGIFLLVRLLFIPQAVVLERKSVFGAFDRSWQLVSGSWWRVFGIGLVLFLIVAIISGVIGALPAPLWPSVTARAVTPPAPPSMLSSGSSSSRSSSERLPCSTTTFACERRGSGSITWPPIWAESSRQRHSGHRRK